MSGHVLAAPGTYLGTNSPAGVSAAFTSSDPNFTNSSGTGKLTVTQEDARVTYGGNLFVGIPLSASSGTITLSATVADITALGPYNAGPPPTGDTAYDPYPGDIQNATVTFITRDAVGTYAAGGTLCTAPVVLINSSDLKTGSVTCTFTGYVGSTGSTQYTVGTVVSNYYTRNAAGDNTGVTISQVGSGMITGGGYLVMKNSAGTFAGTQGTINNFGFNVKYNKSGTNLQGNINTIVRNGGHVYQIKGNSMTSLAAQSWSGSTWVSGCPNGATATNPCKAQFNGSANIQDVTNPVAPISIDGGDSMQFSMTDYGTPGTGDTAGRRQPGCPLNARSRCGQAVVRQ
ncbi:MAG: hypothetical protein DMG21_16970 [Acidobacteria bacterium]|nr:MAG: hypothetical protein DMG21_16970 [Acidobacteriota bacterium]